MSPCDFENADAGALLPGMTSTDLRVEPGWQEIWSVAPAPCGPGCILVAHHTGERTAWVIAPPTVRLRLGEAHKLCDQWRAARYDAADLEELLIAIASQAPLAEQDLTPQDLYAVLPADLQHWVSRVCDRQLALADGFGRQDPRLPPIEAHVRAAATRYAQLAGPAESNRRAKAEFEHAPDDVPDTVDELLGRATGQTQPHSLPLCAQHDREARHIRRIQLTPSAVLRVLGPEHLGTLALINDLAQRLSAKGDLDAARNLHDQALAVFRHLLGSDDLSLLASINDLAQTLSAQGTSGAALDLNEQALLIHRRVLDEKAEDSRTEPTAQAKAMKHPPRGLTSELLAEACAYPPARLAHTRGTARHWRRH
jgi:hypothetical protein